MDVGCWMLDFGFWILDIYLFILQRESMGRKLAREGVVRGVTAFFL